MVNIVRTLLGLDEAEPEKPKPKKAVKAKRAKPKKAVKVEKKSKSVPDPEPKVSTNPIMTRSEFMARKETSDSEAEPDAE